MVTTFVRSDAPERGASNDLIGLKPLHAATQSCKPQQQSGYRGRFGTSRYVPYSTPPLYPLYLGRVEEAITLRQLIPGHDSYPGMTLATSDSLILSLLHRYFLAKAVYQSPLTALDHEAIAYNYTMPWCNSHPSF